MQTLLPAASLSPLPPPRLTAASRLCAFCPTFSHCPENPENHASSPVTLRTKPECPPVASNLVVLLASLLQPRSLLRRPALRTSVPRACLCSHLHQYQEYAPCCTPSPLVLLCPSARKNPLDPRPQPDDPSLLCPAPVSGADPCQGPESHRCGAGGNLNMLQTYAPPSLSQGQPREA